MSRTLTMAVALLAAGLALAEDRRDDEGTVPIDLAVGRTFDVCEAKLILCPVTHSVCDDPNVAVVEFERGHVVLKGVAPGTTLCSVRGQGAFRVVMRVAVRGEPAR